MSDLKILLAVDPGISGCGVSLWHDAHLQRAEYVRSRDCGPEAPPPLRCARMGGAVVDWALTHAADLSRYVLEWPQVRTAGKGRGDPNDLLLLGGVCSAIAARLDRLEATARAPRPRDWKGTIPKEIMVERVRNTLRLEELEQVIRPARSLEHNVWDAVGIGLWAVGRLQHERVIARE